MRFYDVLVNRSVPTEANRGLTSYTIRVGGQAAFIDRLLAPGTF
jgi:hypothetical protein